MTNFLSPGGFWVSTLTAKTSRMMATTVFSKSTTETTTTHANTQVDVHGKIIYGIHALLLYELSHFATTKSPPEFYYGQHILI